MGRGGPTPATNAAQVKAVGVEGGGVACGTRDVGGAVWQVRGGSKQDKKDVRVVPSAAMNETGTSRVKCFIMIRINDAGQSPLSSRGLFPPHCFLFSCLLSSLPSSRPLSLFSSLLFSPLLHSSPLLAPPLLKRDACRQSQRHSATRGVLQNACVANPNGTASYAHPKDASVPSFPLRFAARPALSCASCVRPLPIAFYETSIPFQGYVHKSTDSLRLPRCHNAAHAHSRCLARNHTV